MNFANGNVFALLITLLCTSAYSQDDYYRLRSQGSIPPEFTTLSSQKYEQDKASIDKNESRSTRNAKDEFLLKSNFGIDEILRSGKVVFNDSISVYLNKVKDELLKDNPKLKNEVKVYVTKSPSVNAFATNNGIILVNLGLIAQLDNEAQLAFILAHELTHYTKKHTINEFVENKQIQKGQGEYQGMSSHERELASCRYSQETEMEADLEGLELFKKSSYSNRSILDVFYVLEFAYLPFDDVVFDRAFFDTPDMKFPASYFVDKVKEIKGDTSDDSRSSHPSAGKRREKVSARIAANSKTEDKKDFIVSQSDFLWCRDKSRMEIAHLLLLNRRYEEAIYHTYLLMKKNPQSKYLKKVMAKALYGLSKYKSEDKFYKVHVDHDKIEGESQQVYFFFNTLSASELSALANGYLWNLRKDYPEDLEVKMMSDDLMNNMVQKHYPDKSYFIRNPLDFQKEDVSEKSTVLDTTSKYAKIKKKLKATEDTAAVSYEFIRYAFVDQFKNKEFESAYDRFSDAKKAADNLTSTQRLAIEAGKEKEKKRFRKKGYALGIDRVVLIDPFYARINTKRKEAYRFQFTEEKKTELGKLLKEAGEDVGVQTESLIPVEMTAAEVEKMNDYALMEEWIHERLEHDDLDSVFVSPMQYEASLLSKKYGTAHFGWSGMVWYTERNSNLAGLYMISILYPFVLPYAVYETFTPSHRTLQYTLLYDLNTGKEKMHYVQFFKNKDVSKFTSAGLYYTFLQIKTRAK